MRKLLKLFSQIPKKIVGKIENEKHKEIVANIFFYLFIPFILLFLLISKILTIIANVLGIFSFLIMEMGKIFSNNYKYSDFKWDLLYKIKHITWYDM